MRLTSALLCLIVLSLYPALAQDVTDGSGRATVAATTVRFDAVRSSSGIVPVLYKETTTKDTKAENIHDVIIWRSGTVSTGYTIQDPLRVTSDPEMLALSLQSQISLQGHAVVLSGVEMGFHARSAGGVETTAVTYTLDGVERLMTYEIRWGSTDAEPVVVRVPNTGSAPVIK